MQAKKIVISSLLIGVCVSYAYQFNMGYFNNANSNSYSLPSQVPQDTGNYQINTNYLNNAINNNYSLPSSVQNQVNTLSQQNGNASSAGNNLYNSSLNTLSTKGGIENKINAPMQGGAPLTTFNPVNPDAQDTKYLNNVSHTGNVNLYCSSSKPVVQITVGPASGGYEAVIQQSTQMNGTYDNALTVDISGVCANGFIVCNPVASWFGSGSCVFYSWTADNTGTLSYVVSGLPNENTGPNGLAAGICSITGSALSDPEAAAQCAKHAGCLCVNSSCNISGISPVKTIANYIAGGIQQAIEQANPQYMISKGTWDWNTMTYTMFGQNTQNCNFSSYQKFDNLPFNPYSSSAQSSESAYESDTTSPYQTVQSSMTVAWNNQSPNTMHEIVCSISNSVSISTVNGVDQISTNQYNNCGNQSCSIYDETICSYDGSGGLNCVQTYHNGIKMASPPPPGCITENSALASYQVCMDGSHITVTNESNGQTNTYSGSTGDMWPKVTRVYVCGENPNAFNLGGVTQTIESVSMNGNTINYSYSNPNGGTEPESATAPLQSSANDCSQEMCIVQVPENRSSVYGDQSNRAQTPAGNTVNTTETLMCQQQNGSYVCPVPTGGVIKQDCYCGNSINNNYGFDMAITTLGAIDQAVNQFTCN